MEERIDFKKIILLSVGAVGILALAMVAPNAMQILRPFIKKKRKYDLKSYLNRRAQKLVKDGYLKIETRDKKEFLTLTTKGKRELLYYRAKDKRGKRRWDGKWRIVIFDVWEKSRGKRNILRNEIKDFGFIQLQRSVWIYPYECGDFIELLKTDLAFGKNIRYMVVEDLDHDENLRKFFKLA
ncbi:MAG: hypothetical protein NUV78_01325 [Candidatus Zambryskibacteria bacterium]|nr:hypothetical protein [Candidatus Zambryskibacteria bacterium]